VAKLKAARDSKRKAGGGGKTINGKNKCGGRRSFAELVEHHSKRGDAKLAQAIVMAKRLHRANPKTGARMSLRSIAVKLAEAGHVNVNGRAFNPYSIRSMIEGPMPARAMRELNTSGQRGEAD
jgi:hypothetical protein